MITPARNGWAGERVRQVGIGVVHIVLAIDNLLGWNWMMMLNVECLDAEC